jgi:WD40 repeat protein
LVHRSSGLAFDKIQSTPLDRFLQPGENLIESVAVLRNYLYTTVDNRIRVWDLRNLQGSLAILAGKHSSNVMCLATAQNLRLGSSNCDVFVSGSKDLKVGVFAN